MSLSYRRTPWALIALVLCLPAVGRAELLGELADKTELHLGGNVDFRKFGGPAATPGGFALGSFDTFLLTQVSPSLNVLMEATGEFDADNHFGIDLERAELTWAPAAWFHLAAGRSHTPLGYWNSTFHHATWLFTTVSNPVLDSYEDQSGPLPLHVIGIRAGGSVALGGPLRLTYDLGVSNNRGTVPDPPLNAHDTRDEKALYGALHLGVHALRVGVGGYYDGVALPAGQGLLHQGILVADASYIDERLEVIAEYAYIHDAFPEVTALTQAGYLQLSYAFGELVRPYARVERLLVPEAEHFLTTQDQLRALGGLRFDVTPLVALKVEGGWLRRVSDSGPFAQLQLAWFY